MVVPFIKVVVLYFVEELLEVTKFEGFPVIVDKESQRLAGFTTRRDLKVAMSKFSCHIFHYAVIEYVHKLIIKTIVGNL